MLRRYTAALNVTQILHRDKLTLHALGGLPIRATITEPMHAHLLEVFNDHDAARRRATNEHVDADGSMTARPRVARRRTPKLPNCRPSSAIFSSSPAGPVDQTLGLGHLAFQLVKPEARRRRAQDSMLQSSSSCTPY